MCVIRKVISCFPLGSNEEDPPDIHAKWDGEYECASWEKAFKGQLALFKEEEEGRYRGEEGEKENSREDSPLSCRVYLREKGEPQSSYWLKRNIARTEMLKWEFYVHLMLCDITFFTIYFSPAPSAAFLLVWWLRTQTLKPDAAFQLLGPHIYLSVTLGDLI